LIVKDQFYRDFSRLEK